jgi:DNA-binding CsgD family transcriptional regulator
MERAEAEAILDGDRETAVALLMRTAELIAANRRLESRIADLEQRLSRDSHNSSLPPSADPPSAPPRPRQAASARRPGARPGHAGNCRPLLALEQVMLSVHPEEQYAVRALRAGASGYLTKESAPAELLAAIRKVSTGGRYVSASLAEHLASMLQGDGEAPLHETLSNREYQVMCLIASGKTVSEAARELSLSVKTVSTYRARILEKLKMKNSAELMRYAIKNQFVEQ